jgi:hypothetical protein
MIFTCYATRTSLNLIAGPYTFFPARSCFGKLSKGFKFFPWVSYGGYSSYFSSQSISFSFILLPIFHITHIYANKYGVICCTHNPIP